jgi:hypothetical protein
VTNSNFVGCSTGKSAGFACDFHLFVRSGLRRPPPVFVMQSTDAWHLHDNALARPLYTPRLR